MTFIGTIARNEGFCKKATSNLRSNYTYKCQSILLNVSGIGTGDIIYINIKYIYKYKI